jgi:hypothetical protein
MLLKPRDLSARWNITVATLKLWRKFGSGPEYLKLGTAKNSPVRYQIKDVEEFEKNFKEFADR